MFISFVWHRNPIQRLVLFIPSFLQKDNKKKKLAVDEIVNDEPFATTLHNRGTVDD